MTEENKKRLEEIEAEDFILCDEFDLKKLQELSTWKYIDFKPDSNTRFIFNALTKWDTFNRDEIKHRISETSLIQFLGLSNTILDNNNKIELSRQNLELFFLFANDEYLPYPGTEKLALNCKCEYPSNDSEIEIFTAVLSSLIKKFKKELQTSTDKSLDYFTCAVWGNTHEDTYDSGRISTYEFLTKSLEHKISYLDVLKNMEDQISLLTSEDKNGNYKIKTDIETLKELYKELEENNFIDIYKTELNDFINALKKPWDDHSSVIHLIMDNIQTKHFLILLKQILNIEITLDKIEKAENIKNKNGIIKEASTNTSYSKKKSLPKRADDILKLIKKVKK